MSLSLSWSLLQLQLFSFYVYNVWVYWACALWLGIVTFLCSVLVGGMFAIDTSGEALWKMHNSGVCSSLFSSPPLAPSLPLAKWHISSDEISCSFADFENHTWMFLLIVLIYDFGPWTFILVLAFTFSNIMFYSLNLA